MSSDVNNLLSFHSQTNNMSASSSSAVSKPAVVAATRNWIVFLNGNRAGAYDIKCFPARASRSDVLESMVSDSKCVTPFQNFDAKADSRVERVPCCRYHGKVEAYVNEEGAARRMNQNEIGAYVLFACGFDRQSFLAGTVSGPVAVAHLTSTECGRLLQVAADHGAEACADSHRPLPKGNPKFNDDLDAACAYYEKYAADICDPPARRVKRKKEKEVRIALLHFKTAKTKGSDRLEDALAALKE